jgi:hypothetical protein
MLLWDSSININDVTVNEKAITHLDEKFRKKLINGHKENAIISRLYFERKSILCAYWKYRLH